MWNRLEDDDRYAVRPGEPGSDTLAVQVAEAIANDDLRQLEKRRRANAHACIKRAAQIIAPAIGQAVQVLCTILFCTILLVATPSYSRPPIHSAVTQIMFNVKNVCTRRRRRRSARERWRWRRRRAPSRRASTGVWSRCAHRSTRTSRTTWRSTRRSCTSSRRTYTWYSTRTPVALATRLPDGWAFAFSSTLYYMFMSNGPLHTGDRVSEELREKGHPCGVDCCSKSLFSLSPGMWGFAFMITFYPSKVCEYLLDLGISIRYQFRVWWLAGAIIYKYEYIHIGRVERYTRIYSH